jgi:hypothetical protein
MAIEFFYHLVTRKGEHVICFWKALDEGFPKTYHTPPFIVTKNFSRHKRVIKKISIITRLATENFQSP